VGTTGGPANWFPSHSLMRYTQTRGFTFKEGAERAERLPNPLWLAAKYGGFKDSNNNGRPDLDTEWKRGGSGFGAEDPYNYYEVANISQLPAQLGQAFQDIADSVATGTANAASVNTVLGGGLSIQTQYYSEYTDPSNSDNRIGWLGSVYALFVDKWGNLRADTNGDRRLQIITSPPGTQLSDEKGDLIVHTVSLPDQIGLPTVYLCRDQFGNNNGTFEPLPDNVHPPYDTHPDADCQKYDSMDAVPLVWNAAKNLSERNPQERKLYSYYGSAPGGGASAWPPGDRDITVYPFKDDVTAEKLAALQRLMRQPTPEAAKNLINFIRGVDFPERDDFRNRTTTPPWSKTSKVWRLGDVMNSRPIIVGEPAGNFNLIYRDPSYAKYKQEQARRRQVVYFGSNSGFLHAVNLGFFGSLKTGEAGYTLDPDGTGGSGTYDFGEEIWGYAPTAILPHLPWLANPNYMHNYYVDLTPHVVDMKDTSGWKTVMIVGLRLGGRTIALSESPPQYSYAEYFALDITDPGSEPKLMWRFSDPKLGLTAADPLVVRNGNNWYAVLPSGPTSDDFTSNPVRPHPVNGPQAYEGRSTQKARVIVLNALTGE
jgi:type IV pilus assembly protein PilY1